jgi:murein DD-endopeptidase MepM/ murein hydrolase activator NlpD
LFFTLYAKYVNWIGTVFTAVESRLMPPRPTRPPVLAPATAPRGLLDLLHEQIAQQAGASSDFQEVSSQDRAIGEEGNDSLLKLPPQLPPRPAPRPAPFSDKPVVEWGLRPFVDYGSLRGKDPFGSGALGEPRSQVDKSTGLVKNHAHEGVDVLVAPGSPIYAPASGYIRKAPPRKGKDGPPGVAIQIKTLGVGPDGLNAGDDRVTGEIKMFYVEIAPGLEEGSYVEKGQIIGYSRSLKPYYEPRGRFVIPDHVHFELKRATPRRDEQGNLLRDEKGSTFYNYQVTDPTPWLERWATNPKR